MKKRTGPSLLVIASYPPKGATHHPSIVGGASYTKNTLKALVSHIKNSRKNHAITVLAEQLHGKRKSYTDESIRVERIWKKKSLATFPMLAWDIHKNYKNCGNVLIEFELSMFGSMLALLPLPLFLIVLRLMRKKTTFVFHQVITDINEMAGHINLREQSPKAYLYNICIRILYTLLLTLSHQSIVFDEVLKNRLQQFNSNKIIHVVPLAVESFPKSHTQKQARKKLMIPQNNLVLMTFGFLGWYKGTDWLTFTFSLLPKRTRNKVRLIIAGGPNPNHTDKNYYQSYVKHIEQLAQDNDITVTGFVPEDQMALYFQAADLVLFPYRTLMSASAPLSLAFSFHKPFLLSEALQDALTTADIKNELKKKHLKSEDITFPLTNTFPQQVLKTLRNERKLTKLATLSKSMHNMRQWSRIAVQYEEILFN